jgi:hypothetical protein
VTERLERTARGYRRFRCRGCGKQYNERSGGLLNHSQYPSEVIALVVLWRMRYRLTLRDLAEMFLQRGVIFSYEAVREWEARLAPVLADRLRRRRHGRGGARSRHWHVDETYLKVRGRWASLYRAIDRHGNLVDTMLSERRDLAAAQAFFRSAKAATGVTPSSLLQTGTAPTHGRSAPRSADGPFTEPAHTRITDWSKTTAASKAASGVCRASRAPCQQRGSVEAMTSSATSSVLAAVTTKLSPPATVACSTFVVPQPLTPSSEWRKRKSASMSPCQAWREC